jgi:peptidoglycan DL-endopeptidase CwlO
VNRRAVGPTVIGIALMMLLCLLTVPMLVVGGSAMLFAGGSGANCKSTTADVSQPTASKEAADSIPANYLHWFQLVGLQFNIPWTVLAGIGKVESDDGRTNLPGVTTGSNAFGAAGPMQIGISGASTDSWGGAAIHRASLVVPGVATDEDGDGIANVYDPADAIAGAAKYLVARGAQQNIPTAIFAYNHADWYVQEVLSWASTYATGGFTVASVTPNTGAAAGTDGTGQSCTQNSVLASFVAPTAAVQTAVSFAEQQLGKPYLWGGTGPDAFDCSGLVMMAYQAANILIPRTSEAQWAQLPHVAASNVRPGDLVFFAGSDGTATDPGHVGLVIGKHTMIEAYATGFAIRISSFGTQQAAPGDAQVIGFAQPWPNPAAGKKTGAGAEAAPN